MAPNIYAILTGHSLELSEPDVPAVLVIVTFSSFILVATLFVRMKKGRNNTDMGKFNNPLKNTNVIISIVCLFFGLLHIGHCVLVHFNLNLPNMLFPIFPQGN